MNFFFSLLWFICVSECVPTNTMFSNILIFTLLSVHRKLVFLELLFLVHVRITLKLASCFFLQFFLVLGSCLFPMKWLILFSCFVVLLIYVFHVTISFSCFILYIIGTNGYSCHLLHVIIKECLFFYFAYDQSFRSLQSDKSTYIDFVQVFVLKIQITAWWVISDFFSKWAEKIELVLLRK